MSEQQINPDDVRITVNIAVLHNPGAVRLDGFPLLVHARDQWGPEVCTEDKGVPVSNICNALSVTPSFEAVATQFGTTPAHVEQALAYAHKAQLTAQGQRTA